MMEKKSEKRQADRIDIASVPDAVLRVRGVVRRLLNISDNGFAIGVETPTAYHLGQHIDDIRLDIAGTTYLLNGAVAHITRTITGHVIGIRLGLKSIEEYRLMADLKKLCAGQIEDR